MSLRLTAKTEVLLCGWDELEREDTRLLAEAAIARGRASAPYSHYKVGAAILWSNGKISKGCNIENCVYNVLHAEKCAIATGISAWGVGKIERIAVIGAAEQFDVRPPFVDSGNPKFKGIASGVRVRDAAVSCGQCLQDILEFSYGEDVVMLQPYRGLIMKTSLQSLLPAHFGPSDLGIDYGKL